MSTTTTPQRRRFRAPGTLLACLCAFLSVAAHAGAAPVAVAPLPASDYTVQSVCRAPSPGYVGCLALRLLPTTQAAEGHPLTTLREQSATAAATACKPPKATEACYGLRPADLRDAYFPGVAAQAPTAQTVALVDAYNDPNIEADLKVYDEEFHLPECTKANLCLEQLNQAGESTNLPIPQSDLEVEALGKTCQLTRRRPQKCEELFEAEEWGIEISTDVEVTHAVCQNCQIALVEANSAEYEDLETAEQTAVGLGASEISNSWGGEEPASELQSAFEHPGIVITAASGDDGYRNWIDSSERVYYSGADYPASSPDVVAVGGTELSLSAGGVWQSERVWNEDPDPEGGNAGAAGGGCSTAFKAPEWQQQVPDWSAVGCGTGTEAKRAVADIAADADPYSGVAIYDSLPYPTENGKSTEVIGWTPIGGTSVASPIIASMFALAGGAHGVAHPASTLYTHLGTSALHDVTAGGSGDCDDDYSSCSGSMSPSSALAPLDCGSGVLICNAGSGYDGPTGVGTPNGLEAFQVLPPGQQVNHQTSEATSNTEETATDTQSTGTGSQVNTTKITVQFTSPSTQPSVSTTSTPSPVTNSSTAVALRLTALKLTGNATAALHRGTRAISALAFSFVASIRGTVRARLYREARPGHLQPVGPTLQFQASKGLNGRRLHGSRTLPAGRYRLTVTPLHGSARSITILIP